MTLRERQHDTPEVRAAAGTPTPAVDFRAAAERLLARGADAIDRALSQDSAAFLAANRQEGGQ
jgi:hypothetical protein